MIRFLLISIFLFSSCSLSTTKVLVEKEVSKEEIKNSYFSDNKSDYIYKAKINVYGNNFGGILIIKKIEDKSHRVVLTTEFGNKLFDFLFEDDRIIKNYIIEELDKKIIVKTLQKDFKLLITENILVENQFETEVEDVFKTSHDNRFSFYYFNKNSYTLDKIVSTSKRKEKVEMHFNNVQSKMANTILIKHKNIKLEIVLNKIK